MENTEHTNPSFDEVVKQLNKVGVTDEAIIAAVKALGVNDPADFAELERHDLIGAGLNPVQANKIKKNTQDITINTMSPAANASIDSILPVIPDEGSWLNALKVGGVLKPDQSTVIAAIRAAVAEKVGLFDVPLKLLTEMERFADENNEPVDPVFFRLRQQVTKRDYAELFEAIPGLDGSFVTEARKRQLFERIRTSLWPAVEAGFMQLKSWQENWMQGASNPAMLMMAITKDGANMPPGMMAQPDTSILRDCGDDINNAINSAFKGTGSQVAAALAYDSSEIRKTLEDPRMPMLIGVANREQMIKKLGISISANYARQEQNLVKFVLGFMQAGDLAADAETAYFSALYMLGNQIDWVALGESVESKVQSQGYRVGDARWGKRQEASIDNRDELIAAIAVVTQPGNTINVPDYL